MRSDKSFFVYFLASKRNGTLYIGFTSGLEARTFQHKTEVVKGFTSRYKVKRLVYYEQYADAYTAIQKEKQLKKWNRAWKIRLIEKHNPDWEDLYNEGEILPLPKGGDLLDARLRHAGMTRKEKHDRSNNFTLQDS